MRRKEDVLVYARTLANDLEKDMHWVQNEHARARGYWEASDAASYSRITARAASALEFFRQYAGPDSFWTERANSTYISKGDNQSTETGTRSLGDLLRAWADQVDADVVEIAGSQAWTEVGIVSTDIMTQVRRLLEDKKTHPAAAIVLCGAALEISLRALADARSLTIPPRPTMNSLTTLLRQAQVITVQDVKDLEQCGGVRNLAAHGEFDDLNSARAGLMEQMTNLLLRRLAELHP